MFCHRNLVAPFKIVAHTRQSSTGTQQKRKQNAQEYKLPTVVQMIVRPEKIIVEKTVCYKLGMGETCVLYLHGGSYVDPPLVFHWRFLQQLSRETDVTVYLPLYGRAPQHHCYSTVTHMKQVYMHLVNLYGAQNIVVMGDSAEAMRRWRCASILP